MKIFTNDIAWEIGAQQKDDGKMIVFNPQLPEEIFFFYRSLRDQQLHSPLPIFFQAERVDYFIEQIKRHFQLVEAAGGLVVDQGRVLFIHRLGKWDLPKGKAEKGESPETTALREVEEECGIKPKLVRKIGTTWHTYERNGDVLKQTHWYEMSCEDDCHNIKPQEEESIEKVLWVPRSKALSSVLTNTYTSILEVYQQYLGQR